MLAKLFDLLRNNDRAWANCHGIKGYHLTQASNHELDVTQASNHELDVIISMKTYILVEQNITSL